MIGSLGPLSPLLARSESIEALLLEDYQSPLQYDSRRRLIWRRHDDLRRPAGCRAIRGHRYSAVITARHSIYLEMIMAMSEYRYVDFSLLSNNSFTRSCRYRNRLLSPAILCRVCFRSVDLIPKNKLIVNFCTFTLS